MVQAECAADASSDDHACPSHEEKVRGTAVKAQNRGAPIQERGLILRR